MTHDELARKIVDQHRLCSLATPGPLDEVSFVRRNIEARIAAALKARDVPEGFIRDDKQVDRKVLGTLPLTGDGCLALHDGPVWDYRGVPWITKVRLYGPSSGPDTPKHHCTRIDLCYSTRAAAESARDGGTKA